MPDVSCTAVLIVRDEEGVLDECLRSVRDLVDEVLVLDTGSRDRTREVARHAGARVVESRWRDDFAAARNEGIAQARGRWILSIDADERIERADRRRLIPPLAGTPPVAYRVWLRPDALFTRHRACRLFRNDPRIRFEGRIRESVLPSIRRMTGACAAPLVGDCDLSIEHHDDPAVRGRKHGRDLPLLRQAIRDEGENVVYWTDLGRALAGLGDAAGALSAWQCAIGLVRRRAGGSPADSLPYTDLLQRTAQSEGCRRALLDEACERFPDNWLLVWLRASDLIARRRWADALPLLRELAAIEDERDACPTMAYDRRIFGEFAHVALGTCCAGLGRWTEAAAWYGRAEAAEPASLEYRVKRALALERSSQAARPSGAIGAPGVAVAGSSRKARGPMTTASSAGDGDGPGGIVSRRAC